MSSISATPTPNALSILTGPNGPLANLPFQIPQSVLQSASPTDLAEISVEAEKLLAANVLLGQSTSGPSPYSDPALNSDPALSVLGSIYGVSAPNSTVANSSQQALRSLYAGNGNETTSIPMGTSPSDQYLLSLASADNIAASGTNVTG